MEDTTLPPLDSGRWTFTRHKGHLTGTITLQTRSATLFASSAASYGPTHLTSITPFQLPVTFSPEDSDPIPSDVRPLLDWCRPRIKSAPLQELDPRLWAALSHGSAEQGEEAIRLLTAAYAHRRSRIGFANLIKHCVRSGGPGDPLPVLRAAENLLPNLPRSEADSLASTMSREWPGWRQELHSAWPLNPNEPWDAEHDSPVIDPTDIRL